MVDHRILRNVMATSSMAQTEIPIMSVPPKTKRMPWEMSGLQLCVQKLLEATCQSFYVAKDSSMFGGRGIMVKSALLNLIRAIAVSQVADQVNIIAVLEEGASTIESYHWEYLFCFYLSTLYLFIYFFNLKVASDFQRYLFKNINIQWYLY